jgi:hypothetical protein
VIKTSRPPSDLVPDWTAGTTRTLTRCVRASYRLGLMTPGQPCLLWLSGSDEPGVHALGVLADSPHTDGEGQHAVTVRMTLLDDPVPRAELLADPVARQAEVLRMPAGSNPSWMSAGQFSAVLDRAGSSRLGPWSS